MHILNLLVQFHGKVECVGLNLLKGMKESQCVDIASMYWRFANFFLWKGVQFERGYYSLTIGQHLSAGVPTGIAGPGQDWTCECAAPSDSVSPSPYHPPTKKIHN